MALRCRVVVIVLVLVMGLYILCVSHQEPSAWPSMPGTNLVATSSGSQDSEGPSDRRHHPPPGTTPNPGPPPGEDPPEHPDASQTETSAATGQQKPVLDVSESTSSPRGPGTTRTRVQTPEPRPPQPTKAPGPTEPAFIGDSYMSEDVRPPTDCPHSIRSHVAQTEFGARFLPRVPVLQWAEHATSEQYRRLSKYPGAHGWAGVDYQTLVETLSVLNVSANWQMLDDWTSRRLDSQCSHCAVVGNGGILKGSGKGTEIDGHHYVFRTNGAIIKGFEQDVGSRTTHYTFSTNTLMNSMGSYGRLGYRGPPLSEETRYVFLPDHDRDYLLMKAAATHSAVEKGPEKNKDPLKFFGQDVSAKKLKMYHPDFIRYLRNRFLRSNTLKTKYKDIYRPSTGAVMLLAALHACDQVSAYGFMTPDYKNYSDHYYDSSYHQVGFFINHDLRMEMNLWQQLHQAGLIQLYMHQ